MIAMRHQRRIRYAFTLIEVLVAIGIIGLLLAIAVPVLMRARSSGGQVASLANARSLSLLIEDYVQSHRQVYPSMEAGELYPSNPCASSFKLYSETREMWHVNTLWPGVLSNGKAYKESLGAFYSPGARIAEDSAPNIATSYQYSNAFVGQPQIWDPDEIPTDDMILPVRASQVAHPSKKALLWDNSLAYIPDGAKAERFKTLPGDPLPIAFPDGHAAVHLARDAQAPVPNRLSTLPWRDAPLHNTPLGVEGWDY